MSNLPGIGAIVLAWFSQRAPYGLLFFAPGRMVWLGTALLVRIASFMAPDFALRDTALEATVRGPTERAAAIALGAMALKARAPTEINITSLLFMVFSLSFLI